MVEEAIRSYLAGETREYEVEFRGRHKDGSYRWTLARGVAVRDAGGKPIRFVGSCVDITDRKRAEEALRESEERFRGTFENAAVGIAHTHPEGRFLRVNEKFCAIVGYPREELLEKTWHDITHPDDLAASSDVSAAALRGESPGLPLEKRYLRKDGSLVWVELVISLQRDAAGAPGYLIAIIQDISRRKRLEEALRESERRFRTFVDHATDAFFLLDDRHVVLDVNRQACQSLGYTRDELVGMTPPDLDPDITPANIEEINRKLNAGETVAFESRHRRKDGTVFPVEVRGQAFWEGGRNFVVALARDMTEHKRAEEALRESERRFRILAEALPHMVWTAEPDGATDYYNARTTEYTGLTTEQLQGWGWRSTIHPEDLPRCLELWTRSIATGEPYEIEFRVRRADGAFRWHLARALALRDDSGRITKWFGSCIDIDDQKRAQEALREAKEAAEAANRAKDEFLANVSHEIRTPMNAILGMTELVLDTPLTDDQRQCLKTVKSAADNLLGIINDLLDFSKIEAGKLELDPADFSLRAAVGDTLRALAVRAHRKGLELIYDVQPEVPDALVGDAGRLRQVLLNLVGNAIKFTDAGEVVVRVEVAGDAGTRGRDRPAVHRARHRHRHPPGPAGTDLPGLRAGGQLDHAEVRRHRAGPDDRRAAGGPDGRADHRGERAGPGQHLRLHGAARAPAAPTGAGRLSGRRSCSTTCRCWSSTTTPPTGTSSRSGCAAGRWSRRRSATGWRPWTPSGTPSAWDGRTRWSCSTRACRTPTAWHWPPRSASGPSCPPRGSSC